MKCKLYHMENMRMLLMGNSKCYQKAGKIYKSFPRENCCYGLINNENFLIELCDKANVKEAVRIKNTYSQQEIKFYIKETSLDIDRYTDYIDNWDQQQKAIKKNMEIKTEIDILEAIINNTEIPSITIRQSNNFFCVY